MKKNKKLPTWLRELELPGLPKDPPAASSKEALLLSNTSLLLECTSRVFLDSLQE